MRFDFDNYDRGERAASALEIESAESALDMKFGKELKAYLLQFGHLACGYVCFTGIGSDLPVYRNIVMKTLELQKRYAWLTGYAAMLDLGGSKWAVCNGRDKVYIADLIAGNFEPAFWHRGLLSYMNAQLKAA